MAQSKKQIGLALLLSVFVTWVMVTPLWRSGFLDKQGNLLFDPGATFYDAGVHLSLISEMTDRFPPTNFTLGGIALKNYHYLYDTSLAAIVKLTNVSIFDLYYRIAPVGISLLLCLAIYLTVFQLTRNRWAAAFGIFFTVMATSLGSLFGRPNNLFMTDQIYDWMVNPHGLLALAIFLFLFLCLSYYQETKKIRYLVIFSLLLGISFGVKAYGGVVFVAGGLLAGAWYLLTKNYRPLLAIAAGLGLMGFWIVATTDNSKVGLQFAPLWFLDRMMADYEHLYQADFLTLINSYFFVGNWWHPLALYIKAFLVYLVGSLGLRTFGFIPVVLAVKNIRGLNKIPPANIFLAGTALASFVVPLFFNQSSKPFDIVQFLPYFTLAMGIAFTVFLFRSVSKLPVPARLAVVLLTLTAFLFLDRRELNQRLTSPVKSSKIVLGAPLLQAANYLQTNTPVDSIILLAPTEGNLGYLWFTSVSGRRSVLSGEFFSQQIGANFLPVEEQVKKTFAGQPSNLNFDYLFLQSDEKRYFDKISKQYHLRKIFENEAAVIYKLLRPERPEDF